jgi:hypothetical protein
MTHKITSRLTALLSLLLITAMLTTGCLYTEKGQEGTPSGNSTAATLPEEAIGDIIGKVTYIGTNYYIVSPCSYPETVTDYASIDINKLTERSGSKYIHLRDNTEYLKAKDGELTTVLSHQIRIGSLIARTTTEDGKDQIILLKQAPNLKETADTIGEVVYAGTYITVTLYTSPEEVEDYATLDVNTLTNTGIQGFVYTYSYSNYYIAENGQLNPYKRENIEKGDIVVENTDAEGKHNIIILKKAS